MREKTVTISFRVSEGAFRALQDDAKKQNVSLNTLVNQLFSEYSDFDRFNKKFHPVKLSSPTFKRIIQAATEEAMVQAGTSAGNSLPESFILAKAGELSVQNALEFLKAVATYANMFEYSDVVHGGKTIVTLTHDFGPKWSLFLASYVESIFKAVSKQVKVTQGQDSLTIELQNPGFAQD